ncbi:ribosome biogenesis GTPase Der [Rubinisphaera sp.]|uniref:ribosome biogenesis GTPase Der n=1 Tax=Rubinisphaera sp. TaxID=2024857 RepID=UPI000C10C75E|nr:ribosome biogenesis GTPase Der [Rubinisphaera sp.]MBV11484.1 ribosome biogenesis GTPase Der [Rubinisphaera sp.]HCS52911.1 ribosome biogenesis GTPase Der [Planctomycetaceae bacterium]|tara:strand:- start:466 stop:1824 length:1359 start_codon:yes stop_codon:yes gene_type:complete
MSVPKIAIVGRPNVGKSSIFNWLSGRMVSVVDPTAGVTRDRVMQLLFHKDRYFEVIDTGGIGIVDSDDLSEDVEYQIRIALEEAVAIVFVVDGLQGITPLDQEVAEQLRRIDRPKLLVVNKCESTRTDMEMPQFFGLADAEVLQTSVKANRNRTELLDAIVNLLPDASETEFAEGTDLSADPEMKLAIVGRRNVGKSTFINSLAQTDRMIVSEIAGTTRDSVDVRFELDEKAFIAIDTPGVRKKKSLANDIEFYGLVRAQKSIRRADVVMMMFDASKTISKVDKQLVEEIEKNYKPCIFVVNKWDLGLDQKMTSEKWGEYLIKSFASMRHVPIAFITAKEDKNIRKLINLAQTIYKQGQERVSTGLLNRIVEQAVERNPPPMRRNKRPKVYYATQVGTLPPTIVVKCNQPILFDPAWKRYFLGYLREELPFQEVPIKLYFRPKNEESNPYVN